MSSYEDDGTVVKVTSSHGQAIGNGVEEKAWMLPDSVRRGERENKVGDRGTQVTGRSYYFSTVTTVPKQER